MASKVMTLREAVARFVSDGMSVVAGTTMEAQIPFAAGYEVIRQGKRNLNLVGPISDMMFDVLIGAGVASKATAAWIGNVVAGVGYSLRRALEHGIPNPIEIEDHSNLTMALALAAGAMGVPFMPARTALGSDLLKTNRGLTPTLCPFTGEKLLAVKAIQPDLAIVHVQRCDEEGNAHLWGGIAVAKDAVAASEATILTTEEVVPPELIRSDPNRVIIQAFNVVAVCPVPYGSHPSPTQGYWNRDNQFYLDYHEESRSVEGLENWLRRWVLEVPDHSAYLSLLGTERLSSLRAKTRKFAAPVDYGY